MHLLKYFTRHSDIPAAELKKGILLMGRYGSGKSLLFRALNKLLYKTQLFHSTFYMFNSSELIDEYSLHGRPGLFKFDPIRSDICIDDFGTDYPGKHSFYAEIDDPTEILLQKRYEKFVREGFRTHATTNLDADTLKVRFSPRIYDRFFEMFNLVVLDCESWRRKEK